MARKLKRPNGTLYEEYTTSSAYVFEDGKKQYNDHDESDGTYTGRFWFEFPGGKTTRVYTEKTAPKWLLVLYREATT